ncbi:IGFBP domain-containing protein [Conger conger]|uniref:IGFBP domain-containing protein n=1 Tax=Conger conger TaxID=82655 RepID=UPI002A598802|nr:IGFBP domain-containing protein [Conger conger]
MSLRTLEMLLALGAALLAAGAETQEGEAYSLQALHCPPCERIHCTPRRALRQQCQGGLTTGICGCCPACARTSGETCGGTWTYLGKCDEGLVCVYPDPAPAPADGTAEAERHGVCKEVLNLLETVTCQPACTWEYCRDHPSATCSAGSVALGKQDCHGSCQHTSCSSCLVLKPPACTEPCGPADSACLQRFGRCVHSHMGETLHSTCHQNLHSNAEGYFLCLMPTCASTVS